MVGRNMQKEKRDQVILTAILKILSIIISESNGTRSRGQKPVAVVHRCCARSDSPFCQSRSEKDMTSSNVWETVECTHTPMEVRHAFVFLRKTHFEEVSLISKCH